MNTADLGHLCGAPSPAVGFCWLAIAHLIDCCALGGVDPVLQAYTT